MKTRQQKEQDVNKLQEKLGKAKSVVFADYQGLTMKQLSDLRNKLTEQQAEFTVAKNTLIKLALKQTSLGKTLEETSTGPTAVMFSYEDEITPIKTLVKAFKDAEKEPGAKSRIKAGFLGNDLLDGVSVNRLATLPGKLELRGQVVGMLASPLQGIVGVLQGNLRNLVYALDQIRQQRG